MTPDGTEKLAREMHRSLAVTWGTTAPHAFGAIYLTKYGFAHIPYLVVPVTAPFKHLGDVIPIARQRAFAFLAERGVSDEHLNFRPTVSTGRRRKFVDQEGRNRFGMEHEIRFEMSKTLDHAVDWDGGDYRGTLRTDWEVGS